MASLGQLAAGVAHELNNPVGFVYGNLDVLRERVNGLFRLLQSYDHMIGDQPQSENVQALKAELDYGRAQEDMDSILDDCMEGATRIRDIVQNLRTFSRLDEAELKKSDINEGINSTLRILSKYFSKDNIKLTCELGQLPEIEAYAGQLNQVWMNLLVNAAQAVSLSGGEVTLRTAADGDRIIVSISDTGSGIAPEHLGKIFDPFFTTKPVGEGSGLGLSISFGIIERHGGRIEVESILNEGSKFTVTLPVSAAVRSDAGRSIN
jgi:signal transduction histidine kinase